MQEGLLPDNIESVKSKIHNKIDASAELSLQTKTECHQFQRGLSGDLLSMQDSVIFKQLQALKVRYQQDRLRKTYEEQTICTHKNVKDAGGSDGHKDKEDNGRKKGRGGKTAWQLPGLAAFAFASTPLLLAEQVLKLMCQNSIS